MTTALPLSDSRIRDALSLYGAAPDASLCEAIRTYIELLVRWNHRVSLTTVTDPDDILKFHFGESIAAISAVPLAKGRLADVGSGAGFPGVPLALFVQDLDVTLIESNAKKAAFLSEVQRQLRLPGVRVFRGRAEELSEQDAKFDYVTARAVGGHGELLSWSSRTLNPSGQVILWLGERDASEVSGHPGWQWRHPLKVVGSQKRVLLIGGRSSKS